MLLNPSFLLPTIMEYFLLYMNMQDGHIAFPDFQQFFMSMNTNMHELDHARQQKARPSGVPSQILRDWDASRKAGSLQPAWYSQFHQGNWQGPFKDIPQMSACKLNDSERWQKSFAPQYVDANILKTCCREVSADTVLPVASWQRGGSASVEHERKRMENLVKQARIERKQENLHRLQDQIREKEQKIFMRDQANVETRMALMEDWMQRAENAHLLQNRPHRKYFPQPAVRHAFYSPTKISFYPDESMNMFDRSLPSVSCPSCTKAPSQSTVTCLSLIRH